MRWSAVAAVLLGIAVIMGAFGAHGLKDRLDEYSLGVYEKACFYHFVHALGLLCLPLLAAQSGMSESSTRLIAWGLVLGIIIFSGSLYVLAISGIKWLGAITPIGGTLFIVSWFYLAYQLSRNN